MPTHHNTFGHRLGANGATPASPPRPGVVPISCHTVKFIPGSMAGLFGRPHRPPVHARHMAGHGSIRWASEAWPGDTIRAAHHGGGGLPAPTMLRLVCMAQHSTLNTRTHTNHHTHHIHRGLRAPTGWPAASVTPWRSVMPPGPRGSALGQRPPPCPNHHDDPQGWWRQSRQSRRQGTYCHCPHRLPRIELNRAD